MVPRRHYQNCPFCSLYLLFLVATDAIFYCILIVNHGLISIFAIFLQKLFVRTFVILGPGCHAIYVTKNLDGLRGSSSLLHHSRGAAWSLRHSAAAAANPKKKEEPSLVSPSWPKGGQGGGTRQQGQQRQQQLQRRSADQTTTTTTTTLSSSSSPSFLHRGSVRGGLSPAQDARSQHKLSAPTTTEALVESEGLPKVRNISP